MIVVTFEGFTPPPRYDASAHPWTQVRVEESATATGTFTAIETIALSPTDANPALPATRSFTTTHATLAAGWYRVVFLDAAASESPPTTPIQNSGDPTAATRPTVAQVALKVLARTRVSGQRVLGTFTPADTDPADRTMITLEQAEALIDAGVQRVHGRAGAVAPDLADLAKDVAAEYAAAQIEAALAPEASAAADSAYALHWQAFKDGLDLLGAT